MARRARQLPAGRHGLSRSFVVSNQRERILLAVADAIEERGYASLTVADILARAAVSRRTFYDQFADKRDAFFAAYDASVAQAMAAAAQGFMAGSAWPEQVRRGIHAFLAYLAGDSAFTRMAVLEMPLAGREAYARHIQARAGFEVFLARGPELAGHEVPPLVAKTVGSGIFELIHAQVLAGASTELLSLLSACVYHCLAPYLGVTAAAQEARVAEREAQAVEREAREARAAEREARAGEREMPGSG